MATVFDQEEAGTPQRKLTPSYLIAGDSHTQLARASSKEDSLFDAAADIVTKAIPLSLASGVNQLYNILPTIGSWAGMETEQSDFKQLVKEYDDDLGKYYQDHQMGIDTAGFIASSLAPGLGGIKVLNMGQKVLSTAIGEGVFGKNIGAALGLLAPDRAAHVVAASKTIRETGAVFKLTEANTLKALAAGVGQNALEGAAFTTFVNATMYNSPILEDRDVGDLAWDVVIGAGLGGAVGGLFSGVGTAFKVKAAGAAAERELAPFGKITPPPASFKTSDKILFRAQNLDELPPIPTEGELANRAGKVAQATRDKILLNIREDFGTLAGGNNELADSMFAHFKTAGYKTNRENYFDALAVGKVDRATHAETELNRVKKVLKDNNFDHSKLSPEDFELLRGTKVSYVKVHGEGMSNVSDERPGILNLADKLGRGETISLVPQGLQVGKKLYKNTNNPHQPFNIMGANHYQVEARWAWSERLPKWTDEDASKLLLHADDLPLIQKAFKDGLEKVKVIPSSGVIDDAFTLGSRVEIEEFLKKQKVDIATRLSKAEVMHMDGVTFVDKLKGLFGINFTLVDEPTAHGFFTRIGNTIAGHSVKGDVIALSRNSALRRSLAQSVATLKHEEGHAIFQSLLDSHGINKVNFNFVAPKLLEEIKGVSKRQRPSLWTSKDPKVIKYRESAHELFADAFSWFSRNQKSLPEYPEFNNFAGHLVRPIPQEVIDAVSKRASKPTSMERAKIVDMEESALNGTIRDGGWYARDNARANYAKMLKDAGVRQSADVFELPSYAKVISKSERVKDANGIMVDAATDLKARAKLADEANARVATAQLGEELPNPPSGANRSGNAGPGLVTFENANYGTWGSWSAYVGQRAHALISKAKTSTSQLFTPTLQKIAMDTDAAIEFSVINERLRGLPQVYKYEGGLLRAPGLPDIEIRNPLTAQLIQDHIAKNGERLNKLRQIRAGEGLDLGKSPDLFYPLPRNPKDTPFFAFVVDDSITGTGHSKMIYAKSAEDLEALRGRILKEFPDFKVLTKGESEDYFKAHGKYEFERSINENYINTALARRGVSSSPLPITDPKKIVTDFLDWHLARDASLVRETISHRYASTFAELRASADSALQASKSRFGYISPQAYAENTVNNPATNLIKLALDIQKVDEYPFWTPINKYLDSKVSEVAANVAKLWDNATHPDQLNEINSALTKAGYGGPQVDSALYEAMNGTVPRGTLTAFVAKSNALIGSLALRMDPLNALNNAVGHAVLGGTEGKAVLSAIRAGNAEAVGDLARLAGVKLPGTADDIFSPTKILANSFKRLSDPALKQWHKDKGFITSIMDQYDQTLDAIAIRAGDTGSSLSARMAKSLEVARGIGNTGERLTGNKVAEEFNRFLAADFMKQITDVAVKHGIMDDKAALTYINTFVNRTQGNFLASQRPILFQGPVGQAIGLFQTYQFNLIQQLLRHVGEGQAKNAATMMGLQSTVYGMNGLPGFNAINTYIVGNAGGNTNHADLYQAIFSGAGKDAGEWLAYGALSNAFGIFHPDLKTNMYSRGDINPRSLTIVPTDPAKVPIVQATGKFFSNIKDSVGQLEMGASVWNTMLRGLEHNGVSRPLSGLAQVLGGIGNGEVTATNKQGNLLMAHDLVNWASVSRLAGGKPMDEAIVQDQMFRINTYRSHDAAKRKSLSEVIKTSIIAGEEISQEQVSGFAETYAKYGGKQSEFASYMARQYRNADASQAEQLRSKLSDPYSQQLQRIMNGTVDISDEAD